MPKTGTSAAPAALKKIKTDDPDDKGLMSYDPAFLNTASCRSAITFIDGDKGILRYRGYPIEQLAEKSTFLETSYLLLHGELPTAAELDAWVFQVTRHTIIHENIKKFIDGFHHAGRLRTPAFRGHAVRVPRQRFELHRQFLEHDVQDDRGEVQPPSGARACPGRLVHPARRP